MRLVGPQQEPAWLEEGAVVAGYAIGRAVRRHPGAELRYAAQAADGTPVTLVTSRSPLSSRRERSRFRRLAEYRAALDHPTALAVHAVTERAGHPVLIMDRHPRSTFSDVLHADAPMRPERVVRMLAPVAHALDVAHAHGLIHQSLSADSLLLTRGDRLVLDSFGVLAPETDLTWSTIDAGELLYRAPEQLRGEPLDPRTNVYAFTGLLVHALTGEPPYAGDPPAVIYRHVAGAPPRVSERRPDLPAALDAVVEWGMAKEPFERPWSPTLLLDSVVEAVDVRRRPALVLRPAAPARVPRRAPTADPVAATPWRPPAWIGGNGWAATAAVMAALAVGALAGARAVLRR